MGVFAASNSIAAGDALSASTIALQSAADNAAHVVTESTYEGPAAAASGSAAGSFDPSVLLVLAVGLIGLLWVRRHVQAL